MTGAETSYMASLVEWSAAADSGSGKIEKCWQNSGNCEAPWRRLLVPQSHRPATDTGKIAILLQCQAIFPFHSNFTAVV